MLIYPKTLFAFLFVKKGGGVSAHNFIIISFCATIGYNACNFHNGYSSSDYNSSLLNYNSIKHLVPNFTLGQVCCNHGNTNYQEKQRILCSGFVNRSCCIYSSLYSFRAVWTAVCGLVWLYFLDSRNSYRDS